MKKKMKPAKKEKWVIGVAGVAFSALLLSQLDNTSARDEFNQKQVTVTNNESDLVELDWTNFEEVEITERKKESDRKTKRS
ncbi:MAG TPA: hypothetical protein VF095_10110 [Bacillota bacterium]